MNVQEIRRVPVRVCGFAVLAGLAVVAVVPWGCELRGNAANPQLETKVYDLKCDEGLRYAAKALKARDYKITAVDRGPSGGTVYGTNATDRVNSQIDVTCTGSGVTMKPSGGGAWVEQGLRFGFYQVVSFRNQIYPPPTAPVVRLDLFRGPESKIEFPQELEPAGVVAVRVEVRNAGDRVVRIDPNQVRAATTSGSTAVPLPAAEAERRLAFDPNIASKVLKPTKLTPHQSVVGFVFFPVADYGGGTLFLIDDKTGEADEYSVSFSALS